MKCSSLLAALLLTLSLHSSCSATDSQWGSYLNRPLTLQDLVPPDGRNFSLVHEFNYVDPTGHKWLAPKDLITDGASIPMPFWSAIGGPFEGQYREAAVIHDAACCAQTSPWQDVHHLFYKAMRCSGVGLAKAKTMFFAVWARGPRWDTLNPTMPDKCKVHPDIDTAVQTRVARVIQTRPLSIEETKAVARPFFNKQAMSESDAQKLVADLKQRQLKPEELYSITLSVIQSAQFSDDAVKKTESWIKKNNPSLKEIEAQAEKTRAAVTTEQKMQGLGPSHAPSLQTFFPDVPEVRTQGFVGQ
jgi:hypothetical protein